MNSLILKPGREKSVLQRHPWLFSGAIARVEGSPEPGETVKVRAAGGEFLAFAAYSPASQIRARVWSLDPHSVIDEDFIRERLRSALALRNALPGLEPPSAQRLVHAESDGLPGLVVDRYADFLVLQALSAGAERWKSVAARLLCELTGARGVFERSDVDVRRLEGLPERTGPLFGEDLPSVISIIEAGIRLEVHAREGQKTGFYLDQRANRIKIRDYAQNRECLNCFCYTGGFSLHALAVGARSVLSIDSSADAIEQARHLASLNELDPDRSEWLVADVFQALRKLRDQARKFDLIVLDPPKFAPTAAQAEKAARGYKDINLLALKLLRPGGILFTFSCSGGVSAELFQKIVSGAALDAGMDARILERLHQSSDHPVALAFPEGEYLKGLICQTA